MCNFVKAALVTAIMLAPLGGLAADKAAESVKVPDPMQEEADLDEGLRKFGYLTGLALGCVMEKQRPALEREAMNVANGIIRTLGGDRAFLYSASFGYGSNIGLKVDECKEVLERYEQRIARFRKSEGAGQ